MSKLQLAVKEMFEGNEVGIYQTEDGSPVMTIDDLAKSLGYADRSGVQKIVNRNPYLKDIEFSTEDKLSLVEGNRIVSRVVRIFNEDGIYEITMLSKKPKAREFRAFVRKLLKQLRKGDYQLAQPSAEHDKLLVQKLRAEAMLLNARTRQAKLILQMQKEKILSPVAVELLQINALEAITNKPTEYRPYVEEKHYTATEVGKMFGVSSKKIGSLAKKHNLKTNEFGIWVLDKSPYSNKQVESFKYNQKAVEKFKCLLSINEAITW